MAAEETVTLLDLRPQIERHARRHNLEPGMVAAIVTVESGGNAFAWRPEPAYRWLWDVRQGKPFRSLTPVEISRPFAPADFPALAGSRDQEWNAQRASWGLMQIMGALARELDYDGLYLTRLTDPEINLDLGCRHLEGLLRWAEGNGDKAIGAYNAGRGGWDSDAALKYRTKVKAAWARDDESNYGSDHQ